MMSQDQHGATLLRELDLLHQAQRHRQEEHDSQSRPLVKPSHGSEKTSTPTCRLPLGKATKNPSGSGNRRRGFCFQKWKRPHQVQRSRCLVCLQVHHIKDLPVSMNGRAIVVGWRTKGWEGEETLPVHSWEGKASFDEIFLHYCNIRTPCVGKSFTVRVSLLESKECDLGTFQLSLNELMLVGNSSSKFSGKTMTFDLCGTAAGGSLSVSFYYTIIDSETQGLEQMRCNSIRPNQTKSNCFFCLPDLKRRKNGSPAGSTRKVTSVESDLDFITIENSAENHSLVNNDEGEGFITIEKGIMRTRSWRPPSDNSSDCETDRRNPSVGSEFYEESEVDQVEDEFLRMLEEEKQGKTEECTTTSNAVVPWEKEMKELEERLNEELGFDLDLGSVLKAAEDEVLKATQVWKSRVEARALEKAEYEELLRKWREDEKAFELTSCLGTVGGFGSPI